MQLFFYLLLRPYSAVLGSMAKSKQVLASAAIAAILSGILMIPSVEYGLIFVVAAYGYNSFFSALLTGLWAKKEAKIDLGIRQVIPISLVSFSIIIPSILINFARLNPFLELAYVLLIFIAIYVLSIRYLWLVTANEITKAVQFLPGRVVILLTRTLVQIFMREKGTGKNGTPKIDGTYS